MNITQLTPAVPVPTLPVQDITVDQAKEQQLAEAQANPKQSVVYFSPVIKIDRSTNTAILQFRDRNTGEVTRESPTKSEIQAYTPKRADAASDDESHLKEDA